MIFMGNEWTVNSLNYKVSRVFSWTQEPGHRFDQIKGQQCRAGDFHALHLSFSLFVFFIKVGLWWQRFHHADILNHSPLIHYWPNIEDQPLERKKKKNVYCFLRNTVNCCAQHIRTKIKRTNFNILLRHHPRKKNRSLLLQSAGAEAPRRRGEVYEMTGSEKRPTFQNKTHGTHTRVQARAQACWEYFKQVLRKNSKCYFYRRSVWISCFWSKLRRESPEKAKYITFFPTKKW